MNAGVHLNLNGARTTLLVNHWDATSTRAILLNSLDNSLCDGVGLVCWSVCDAYKVVILRNVDGGGNAKTDGRAVDGLIILVRLVCRASQQSSIGMTLLEEYRHVIVLAGFDDSSSKSSEIGLRARSIGGWGRIGRHLTRVLLRNHDSNSC